MEKEGWGQSWQTKGRQKGCHPALSHLLNDSEGLLESADEVTEVPRLAGRIISWGLQEFRHVHNVNTW